MNREITIKREKVWHTYAPGRRYPHHQLWYYRDVKLKNRNNGII